jgi:hypothetical protein
MTRWLILAFLLALAGSAHGDDRERVMSETCSLISQQRNNLSDAVAVSEAKRKLAQERIEQWETYFKTYIGEARS